MDRLLREGNPPAGQLASPKPQYKDVQTNNWEELKGEGGASYVKDKDVFAKLEQARALLDAISGKDFATQPTLEAVLTELANVKSELEAIKANQLSGDQKVQLSGTIVDLLPRNIRTVSTPYANIIKPRWAKGFILSVMVYGLTGQMTGENDGISLEVGFRGHNTGLHEFALASTAKYKTIVALAAIAYPGAIINDDKWGRSGQRIVAGIPAGSNIYYRLNISGIFNAGEGIDCDAKIEWLP